MILPTARRGAEPGRGCTVTAMRIRRMLAILVSRIRVGLWEPLCSREEGRSNESSAMGDWAHFSFLSVFSSENGPDRWGWIAGGLDGAP